MGKGDRKTKRGKLFLGSSGKLNKKKPVIKTIKPASPAATVVEKKPGRAKKKE